MTLIPTHSTRKHAKLSASGAERWMNCPGSVALSEGIPDKDSKWSLEGTQAHEVLEIFLKEALLKKALSMKPNFFESTASKEMKNHAVNAAHFILNIGASASGSQILVETKIHLGFIHPEMFGTFDGAVVDYFGTLHVFDYKYGAGYAVSPTENMQMIFYGMGLAHLYDWNFKKVRLWIIQPRIKSYDGPIFWELGILELKKWVAHFKKAVKNVEENPNLYVEGSWCHWCKAKGKCPLKQEGRLEKAISVFTAHPHRKGK